MNGFMGHLRGTRDGADLGSGRFSAAPSRALNRNLSRRPSTGRSARPRPIVLLLLLEPPLRRLVGLDGLSRDRAAFVFPALHVRRRRRLRRRRLLRALRLLVRPAHVTLPRSPTPPSPASLSTRSAPMRAPSTRGTTSWSGPRAEGTRPRRCPARRPSSPAPCA